MLGHDSDIYTSYCLIRLFKKTDESAASKSIFDTDIKHKIMVFPFEDQMKNLNVIHYLQAIAILGVFSTLKISLGVFLD